ncbi:IMP cyclohydrolase [Candidatus Woesearchaeota archaeon]|nr:IMP cyclohydrolase [Candidatus Woesearchaeota archaeon]
MNDKKKPGSMYTEALAESFPSEMSIMLGKTTLRYRKKQWAVEGKSTGLRYGDNPGQEAALYELAEGKPELGKCGYISPEDAIISNLNETDIVETGKTIGKSNLTDLDAAINILKYFDEPTAMVMKHNNPSGAASRNSIKEAYVAANMTDRIAAFGGVVVVNRAVGKATAEEISKNYVEVVAAPEFEKEAKDILMQKKNMRLITMPKLARLKDYREKRYIELKALMDGGIILQQSADNELEKEEITAAEAEYQGRAYRIMRQPTGEEIEDMLFAWKIVQGVISNSMVFVKGKTTVAIGTGEQDRVGATELAIVKAYKKAADRLCFERYGIALWQLQDKKKLAEIEKDVAATNAGLKGSVLASDGFLPFRDTIDVAAKQGVAAIIQPGGSTRDYQSIEACNEHGMTMVFTGKRVFRH